MFQFKPLLLPFAFAKAKVRAKVETNNSKGLN